MQYRSKPVEIEAWQFELGSRGPDWLQEAVNDGRVWYQGGESPYMTIRTLEGEMRANLGDWIIRGTEGELYPCKPSVFERKYEPVS